MDTKPDQERSPEKESSELLNRFLALISAEPRTAILMSGTGSNAEVILQQRARYPSIDFVGIGTDHSESNASRIANDHGLELICPEISITDSDSRRGFFATVADELDSKGVELLLYAGFMRVVPAEFLRRFPGVNIHPADLTIRGRDRRAKYVGMPALSEMAEVEGYVAATVHLIEPGVDQGIPIAVSDPLPVDSGEPPAEIHERLKQDREHVLYPAVLEKLAKGHIDPCELPLYLGQP